MNGMRIWGMLLIVWGILTPVILGCQDSHIQHSTTRGVAIKIHWPTATAAQHSRFIPLATQSIVITVNDTTNYSQTNTVTRPESGDSTSTFTDIPLNGTNTTVTVTATAYPNPDGTGTALAKATVPVTIPTSGLIAVRIDMNSTIEKLTINNIPSGNMVVGVTQQLTATAYNAYNSTVTLTAQGIYWRSLNPDIVSIDPVSGEFSTHAPGIATIKAIEKESGIIGQCTITVAL